MILCLRFSKRCRLTRNHQSGYHGDTSETPMTNISLGVSDGEVREVGPQERRDTHQDGKRWVRSTQYSVKERRLV
ncbi:hypothetical protein BaRGS_00021205 [Batillaria attramentaria]|uniref:Uncharacterized protein n=1 Tax=Batillaria attramentaria TaxID=370345 RepID=A0ABD0KKF5_9CAEN